MNDEDYSNVALDIAELRENDNAMNARLLKAEEQIKRLTKLVNCLAEHIKVEGI